MSPEPRADVPRVISGVRYVHTNLVAYDWRALARFYQELFGCLPVPPERDLSGPEMEAGTGVAAARLRGMHLRLPGVGPDGPTLEIFEYAEAAADAPRVANRPGFAHIAFAVDSVAEARDQVLSRGGSPVGEVVTVAVSSTVHEAMLVTELLGCEDVRRLGLLEEPRAAPEMGSGVI